MSRRKTFEQIDRTKERQLETHLREKLIANLRENKNSSVSQTLSPLSPAHHREVQVGFRAGYCLVLFIKVQLYFKRL
jgi:hypothetical protein